MTATKTAKTIESLKKMIAVLETGAHEVIACEVSVGTGDPLSLSADGAESSMVFTIYIETKKAANQ